MYCDMQYDECVNGDVTVSAYLQLSDETASDGGFCWDYILRFENTSDTEITLLSKELSVLDDKGHVTSVNYQGFKGQLPMLIPGEDFEDDGYVTSKSSALLKGKFIIKVGDRIQNLELPVFNLIANDNRRVLN